MGLEVGGKGDTKEKKKEDKNFHMYIHMYESIGHQPLWGRWPKGCLSDSVLWKTKSGARISQSVRANGALFHLFQFG